MRHRPRERFPDQREPEDDVDRLFHRLEPVEPPADLVARILNALSHLSARPSDPAWSWDQECHGEGLVVRNEQKEPS